jgi:cytochrome c oxidase subunit 2
MWDFPLFPDQASSIAADIDLIYFVLIALSLLFTAGVVVAILYFAIRYRSGARADRSNPSTGNVLLETTWMVIPTFLGIGVFAWAAVGYFNIKKPPEGRSMKVYAIGKQWMWKFKHPNGPREINTLHVPKGATVRMQMTSQDVIHSFYVPAFRVKQDVLPGRYTNTWFKATKTGKYRLFCAEYCGTEHSYMGGWVRVMEPAEYERWLRTGGTGGANTEPGTGRFGRAPSERDQSPSSSGPWGSTAPESADPSRAQDDEMAAAGQALFQELRCNSCHRVDSSALYPAQGPVLQDVHGYPAELQNNRTIIADDEYIRESIVYPQSKLVAGYPPIMPTYKGQVSETELLQLVAYIRSLSSADSARARSPQVMTSDTTRRTLPAPADTAGGPS